MTADYRPAPGGPAGNGVAGRWAVLTGTVPGAAFAATILFDALSLLAANESQARSYRQSAANLLTLGLNEVLASIALETIDDLCATNSAEDPRIMRRLARNGAVAAVYLLAVAARRKPGATTRMHATASVGWSLLGLALLGISGKRR